MQLPGWQKLSISLRFSLQEQGWTPNHPGLEEISHFSVARRITITPTMVLTRSKNTLNLPGFAARSIISCAHSKLYNSLFEQIWISFTQSSQNYEAWKWREGNPSCCELGWKAAISMDSIPAVRMQRLPRNKFWHLLLRARDTELCARITRTPPLD